MCNDFKRTINILEKNIKRWEKEKDEIVEDISIIHNSYNSLLLKVWQAQFKMNWCANNDIVETHYIKI
jgi:phage-related tail protein